MECRVVVRVKRAGPVLGVVFGFDFGAGEVGPVGLGVVAE